VEKVCPARERTVGQKKIRVAENSQKALYKDAPWWKEKKITPGGYEEGEKWASSLVKKDVIQKGPLKMVGKFFWPPPRLRGGKKKKKTSVIWEVPLKYEVELF